MNRPESQRHRRKKLLLRCHRLGRRKCNKRPAVDIPSDIHARGSAPHQLLAAKDIDVVTTYSLLVPLCISGPAPWP